MVSVTIGFGSPVPLPFGGLFVNKCIAHLTSTLVFFLHSCYSHFRVIRFVEVIELFSLRDSRRGVWRLINWGFRSTQGPGQAVSSCCSCAGLVVETTKLLRKTTSRRGGLRLKTSLLNARLKVRGRRGSRTREEYIIQKDLAKGAIEVMSEADRTTELVRHLLRELAADIDVPVAADPKVMIVECTRGLVDSHRII